MEVTQGSWISEDTPQIGDYGQWWEHDAEVIDVNEVDHIVYLELSNGEMISADYF